MNGNKNYVFMKVVNSKGIARNQILKRLCSDSDYVGEIGF
jgi:hypothetical protein